jgi:DNA-binding NarL/FixJ family response regulator
MSEESKILNAPSTASIIKVAVIEDQREIRECLAILINGTEGFCCTGSFETMEEALVGIGNTIPDLALVDIGLPGMSGIDGIRHLRNVDRLR